ncbi:family 20 glycosylhydrolase [Fibrella aquatilis]|uniref:beta-N-acetylhexosaminidase n=1 Tax=Fibrella aquatilis TaxID=2817059 RepID=A0A939G2K2_9BACT|nr:family 20 glycosylhydrolase [Fibrella aquatilis]MBO0931167.1 family 20 glycosylhydrolase [Fibrella aquatilis]
MTFSRFRLALPGLLLVALFGSAQAQVMPQPVYMQRGQQRIALSQLSIRLPASMPARQQWIARMLLTYWQEQTGVPVPVKPTGNVTFQVTGTGGDLPKPGETAGPTSREAYHLRITRNGVAITANSAAGLFHAVQTLRQLVSGRGANAFLPEVSIDDWPAMPYRGFMWDCSHGGRPSVAGITRMIDQLARYKANQFYLYSESNLAIDGHPLIGEGMNFAKSDIDQIITYAHERFVEVVPHVNLYGHNHALLRTETYANLGMTPHGQSLDPTNPQAKVLVADIVRQVADWFPSPFVHVGFDEVWEVKQMAELAPARKIDPAAYYLDHLTYVNDLLRKRGKTVLFWHDIVDHYPALLDRFPKETVPVAWEYETDTARISHWLNPLVASHKTHFIQTGIDNERDVYPTKTSFDNIDALVSAGRRSGAAGYIGSLWNDAVQTLPQPAYPAMIYGVVSAWQDHQPDQAAFRKTLGQHMYPADSVSSRRLSQALDHLELAQLKLTAVPAFNEGTLTNAYVNPFGQPFLGSILPSLGLFRASRLEAETALATLIPLQQDQPDNLYVQSLVVSARLLDVVNRRFINAIQLNEKWEQLRQNPKLEIGNWLLFFDAGYASNGRTSELIDAWGELESPYAHVYQADYTNFRLQTVLNRFRYEQLFWRQIQLQMLEFYQRGFNPDKPMPTLSAYLGGAK